MQSHRVSSARPGWEVFLSEEDPVSSLVLIQMQQMVSHTKGFSCPFAGLRDEDEKEHLDITTTATTCFDLTAGAAPTSIRRLHNIVVEMTRN